MTGASWTDASRTLTLTAAGANGSFLSGSVSYPQLQLVNGLDTLTLCGNNQYHSGIHANNGLAVYCSNIFSIGTTWQAPSVNGQVQDNNGLNISRHTIRFSRHAAIQGGVGYYCIINIDRHQNDDQLCRMLVYGQDAYPSATTNIVGGTLELAGGAGASSSAGAADGGAVYLDGGQGYGTGEHGDVVVGATRGKLQVKQEAIFTKTAQLATYTVGTLPSAATAGPGALAMVSDANSTTNGSTVAAGGSNKVAVKSDGTNWIILG